MKCQHSVSRDLCISWVISFDFFKKQNSFHVILLRYLFWHVFFLPNSFMFTWLIYFDNFTELLIHLFSSVFFLYMIHFSRDFLETGLIIQFIYFNVIFFFSDTIHVSTCIYIHMYFHMKVFITSFTWCQMIISVHVCSLNMFSTFNNILLTWSQPHVGDSVVKHKLSVLHPHTSFPVQSHTF